VGEIRFARYRRLPHFLVREQRELAGWIRSRGPGPAWFCDVKVGCEVLHAGGLTPDHIVDSRRIPFPRNEHFVDRWIRLANFTPPALEGQLPDPAPPVASTSFIDIDAGKRAALDSWLAARGLEARPMVVLQIGNRKPLRRWMPRKKKSSDKFWPEDRWVEVIHALRERHPDHAILLLGTMKEFAMNERIKAAASSPDVHNVSDHLPIPTLLPLLERAAGMISVDTGPAHAAAALGCPTVALFGDANTALYRPGGPHTPAVVLTGRSEEPGREGRLDITAISVASVMDAWGRLGM
jgi:heptosyltransferase-2/heptosyltransferase-3